MKRLVLPSLLGVLLALGVTACGVDDTSLEAQLEKARIAIDAGDYASAEGIVEALCIAPPASPTNCSDELLALLAEARMGQGGVDLLSLLSDVDGVLGTDSTTVFLALAGMFAATGVPPDALTDLQDAIAALEAIAVPTASDQLQLAVAYATHLVATIVGEADPGNTGTYTSAGLTGASVTAANIDLPKIITSSQAAEALLIGFTGTDVTDGLEALRDHIEGPGADGTVTLTELQAYVDTL